MLNIPLTNLALAFIPVLVVLIIIWRWNIGIKSSLYAIFRMVIQLLLIGYVLTYIFETNSNYIVISVLSIMLVSASWISLRTSSLPRRILLLNAINAILKTSLIPITNMLLAVGLVSLPGMMTGQILSGVSPMIAVRYQIMVMCMFFSSTGISVAVFLQSVRGQFKNKEIA